MELIAGYRNLPDGIKKELDNANVFFSEEYANYATADGNEMLYVLDKDIVIPIVVYSKVGIRYGVFESECYSKQQLSKEEEKAFLGATQLLLKQKAHVAWISTTAASFFNSYPSGSKRIPFGSHVIDLQQDTEVLWNNVHSKHRNSVRRAEKSEVVIKHGKDNSLLEDYMLLDEETWKRSNKQSYGKAFFETMVNCLKDKCIFFVAYKDERPQAGAFFLYNSEMCYYMYGASIDQPETGSTNMLHWEAIKYFKAESVKKYSFVGCRINEDEDSKYHGIQRFKERFGGELVQGCMFKSILSPIKYNVFRELYRIKKGRDLTDAIDEEIDKWKDLNSDNGTF